MTWRIVSVALSGLVSPRIPARNNRDMVQSWLTKTPIKIVHFKFFALKASKLWMCREDSSCEGPFRLVIWTTGTEKGTRRCR
jgi:hypothetical protein